MKKKEGTNITTTSPTKVPVSCPPLAFERRRSLNPDEATLASQAPQPSSAPTGTNERRRSLFDQMSTKVSPRRNSATGKEKESE